MKVDFTVNAEIRTDVGKGASRRLRHTGKIPSIVYGGGKETTSLMLVHDEMSHHLEHEAFYSHILSLKLDGKAEKVVLKDIQRHPGKSKIMHMDFQRVSSTDKLHMHIPLHFAGEEAAPGIKAGGLASHLMTGVDIVCMAKDLPEYLEVDISGVDLDGSLHLSDIPLPKGVEIPALAHGEDHDLPVFSIHAPRGGGDDEEKVAEIEEGGEEEAASED